MISVLDRLGFPSKKSFAPSPAVGPKRPPQAFSGRKRSVWCWGGGKAGMPPWQFGPNEFAKCLVGRKGANRSTQPKLLDRVELKARLHPGLLGGKDKTCDSHGRYSQMMMSSPPENGMHFHSVTWGDGFFTVSDEAEWGPAWNASKGLKALSTAPFLLACGDFRNPRVVRQYLR